MEKLQNEIEKRKNIGTAIQEIQKQLTEFKNDNQRKSESEENIKYYIKQKQLTENEIQSTKSQIVQNNAEYKTLGIFAGKRKKVLEQTTRELSEKVNLLMSELSELNDNLTKAENVVSKVKSHSEEEIQKLESTLTEKAKELGTTIESIYIIYGRKPRSLQLLG